MFLKYLPPKAHPTEKLVYKQTLNINLKHHSLEFQVMSTVQNMTEQKIKFKTCSMWLNVPQIPSFFKCDF